jgi:hypothetical protein
VSSATGSDDRADLGQAGGRCCGDATVTGDEAVALVVVGGDEDGLQDAVASDRFLELSLPGSLVAGCAGRTRCPDSMAGVASGYRRANRAQMTAPLRLHKLRRHMDCRYTARHMTSKTSA